MNAATDLSFAAPGLHGHLAQLSQEQLDRLDFGVIGFDADSNVCKYNQTESDAAGLSPPRVLGQPLFTNVAPCLNNFMVAQRFEDAARMRQRARRHHRLRADPAHAAGESEAAPAGRPGADHALRAGAAQAVSGDARGSWKAEHEALMQFLYLAPVGLVQTGVDGEIVMINPIVGPAADAAFARR
jgi:photoactive yellow protein